MAARTVKSARKRKAKSALAQQGRDPAFVRIKPPGYKPSREDLEEVVTTNLTPEELARGVGRRVKIVRDEKA